MDARLQFKKRKIILHQKIREIKLEMEMSIKMADLAAREALLDSEETEPLLERK